jgi:hypothetical protein
MTDWRTIERKLIDGIEAQGFETHQEAGDYFVEIWEVGRLMPFEVVGDEPELLNLTELAKRLAL